MEIANQRVRTLSQHPYYKASWSGGRARPNLFQPGSVEEVLAVYSEGVKPVFSNPSRAAQLRLIAFAIMAKILSAIVEGGLSQSAGKKS